MKENQKMLDIIKKFPEELKNPFLDSRLTNKKVLGDIAVCGMGGSAIAGQIAGDVYGVNLQVIRDYNLPKLKENSLVIVCSYSGNTEETISCFNDALSKGFDTVVVTSGGLLLEECKKRDLDWIQLRAGVPPRTAFPNLFGSVVKVLESRGLLDIQDFSGFADRLNVEEVNVLAAEAAESFSGKIPVIYTYDFPSVAKRIKDEFNENSKMHCRFETFPELNHNDVNCWLDPEFSRQFMLIFLHSGDEPERIKKIMNITKNLLEGKVKNLNFQMQGNNRVEKALNTILFFDLLSMHLAEMRGIDGYNVKIITEFKRMLKD